MAIATMTAVSTGLQVLGGISSLFGSDEEAEGYESQAAAIEEQIEALRLQLGQIPLRLEAIDIEERGIDLTLEGIQQRAEAESQARQATIASLQHAAEVSQQNAALARWGADDARARGQVDENELRDRVERDVGIVRSRYAAGGVVADVGSPMDMQRDVRTYGELDALTIRANADREAFGFEVQAFNYGEEARAALSEAYYEGRASDADIRRAALDLEGAALGRETLDIDRRAIGIEEEVLERRIDILGRQREGTESRAGATRLAGIGRFAGTAASIAGSFL